MGEVISIDTARAARALREQGQTLDAIAAQGSPAPASTPAQPLLPGPTAQEMQERARRKLLEQTKTLARRVKHKTDHNSRW